MFFGEDSLKGLKKELKAANADMHLVKGWQKEYDKVKKNCVQFESQYNQAKNELNQVHTILRKMEQTLIAMKGNAAGDSFKGMLSESVSELKKYQGHFNQEFLIGKEDKEFHLIYETILSLTKKGLQEKRDLLILQSEVENILAIVEEALAKEWPSFRAMAYFYLKRTDKEIYDLPHSDKVQEVNRIYEKEFLAPMYQVLRDAFGDDRANQILEVDVWN